MSNWWLLLINHIFLTFWWFYFASFSYFLLFLLAWMRMYVLTSELASGDSGGKKTAGRLCQKFLSDYVWLQWSRHSPSQCYSESKWSGCTGKERTLSTYSTGTHPKNPFSGALPNCLSVLTLGLKHPLVPFHICLRILFSISFWLWFRWNFFSLFSVFSEFLKLHG